MARMTWIFSSLAVAFVLASAAPSAAAVPQPAPQPNAAALKDGLAVRYYSNKFNHIRELETWMKYKEGSPGDTIAMLDYDVGKGPVLTSGVDNLVGAHITGYIGFDAPGVYRFEVTSNDGVRLTLGGVQIYEDPDVHPNRTSEPILVTIDQAGWYPIDVLYFEKKNTSTLELRWTPPGGTGFDFVPASALKH